MVGRLILGLIWLTCVQSDTLNIMPMKEAMNKESMMMPAAEVSSGASMGLMPIKTKRYLSHHHSSPCPPFYPHFGMHMPMYDTRPYGPPAYPKNNDIHMPMYHDNHELQYVHQPTYSSYVPKQTVQYVKPQIPPPMYQHPMASPPIHQPTVFKQPPMPPSSYYHQYQQQPMYQHKMAYDKQPVWAYAPAYHHKPMPMQWPMTQIKKIDYPVNQIAYNNHQPAIVYKPDAPKCAPCPPAPQIQSFHPPQAPSISYVKIAQPLHQVDHSQSKVYLPPPVHQPIVKPCRHAKIHD